MENETIVFFNQLLSLTKTMVDDIVPGFLLDMELPRLQYLMQASQEVNKSLEVFIKLCGVISRTTRPSANSLIGTTMMANVTPSIVDSSGDDRMSVKTNVGAELESEGKWRQVLTDARMWYLTHDDRRKPPVYYCGICDVQAKYKDNWEAHVKGKSHEKNIKDVPLVNYQCDKCGLVVCCTPEQVIVINASEEHTAFDQVCQDLRPPSSARSDLSESDCSVMDPPTKKEKPKTLGTSVLNGTPGSRPMEPTRKPVITQQSKAPQKLPSKVMFQNTEIHSNYVHLTEEVAGFIKNRQAFEIGFCLPCNIICHSKEMWLAHKKTEKHEMKMSCKAYKNVLCKCHQCEFVVTAGHKIAIVYMKYHIEKCHFQCTNDIEESEYMEIKQVVAKIQPARSFKGSHETLCSIPSSSGPRPRGDDRSSSVDLHSSSIDLQSPDVRSESRPGTAHGSQSTDSSMELYGARDEDFGSGRTPVKSAARNTSTVKPTRKSTNPYKKSAQKHQAEVSDFDSLPSPADQPENDNFVCFAQMLHRKEQNYTKDRSCKLFTGLCTLCQTSDFPNRFAWMDHVIDHPGSEHATEVECSECNSCFFGDERIIKKSFLSHDYHKRVDSLMNV